ncbi:MAG: type II toxin-antitoxin system RelE/ParE family toxin [Hyphomicrobiaceae bacterium]|nr:type II toxin-antitoxin system RelE/ParE family toxin [Hyphomicrobiaceae bacterium]
MHYLSGWACAAIRNFRGRRLRRFWKDGQTNAVDPRHATKLRRQLGALEVANSPQGMNIPGWRYHALKGQDKGRWAVWVDQNWRLTFAWSDDGPDAVDVDYEDYH